MERERKRMDDEEKLIEDPNTLEHYAILRVRIDGIDPAIEQYHAKIEELRKEIERLTAVKGKLTDEQKQLDEKHPTYKDEYKTKLEQLSGRSLQIQPNNSSSPLSDHSAAAAAATSSTDE